MNKKLFGIALLLATIVVVAAVAPALAINKTRNPPVVGTEYVYGKGGYVVLNLPSGGTCNKTDIRIGAADVDTRSTKGAEDYLDLRLWVPSKNAFQAIVIINDNPAAVDSIKKTFVGVPYIVAILVEDSTIDVWTETVRTDCGSGKGWKDAEVLVVNLTKPVDIRFGNPLPPTSIYRELNFTLPPMTLKFVKTGEVNEKAQSTTTFPSGWNRTQTEWIAPAWASVTIPTWTGSTAIPIAGVLYVKQNSVYTPPPAP